MVYKDSHEQIVAVNIKQNNTEGLQFYILQYTSYSVSVKSIYTFYSLNRKETRVVILPPKRGREIMVIHVVQVRLSVNSTKTFSRAYLSNHFMYWLQFYVVDSCGHEKWKVQES